MDLSVLLPFINNMPEYRQLKKQLLAHRAENKVEVLRVAEPYLIASLYEELRLPILVLTTSPDLSRKLYEQLKVWNSCSASMRHFPAPDALPYERLTTDLAITRERLKTLSMLTESNKSDIDYPPLIVTSALAVMRKTIPANDFTSSCHVIREGMALDPEAILLHWQAMGYERENAVELPGEMSQRGGIIDIYPAHSELPARIELSGNKVESLRLFDPTNQRSLQIVSSVTIIPAREVLIPRFGNSKSLEHIIGALELSGCNTEMRERINTDMSMLHEGQWFPNVEFYAPLFRSGCIFDYLPRDAIIIITQPDAINRTVEEMSVQAEDLRRVSVELGELPSNFPRPYFNWAELDELAQKTGQYVEFWRLYHENPELSREREGSNGSPTATSGAEVSPLHMTFTPAPNYGGQMSVFLRELKEMLHLKQRIVVISNQASRLFELLEDENINVSVFSHIENLPPSGSLTLVQGSLDEGWQLSGDGNQNEDTISLLTDAEIFGFTKQRRLSGRRPVRRQAFLSDISPGNYVVHIDHGIARFAGMTRIQTNNIEREYLILEYAAGDKLYVPTDQVDRISSYVGGGETPAMSRLGTAEWARVKQKVKDSVNNIAQELLGLYAAREVISGFAFGPDTVWQQELEASFPYMETSDQLEAVQAVKEDMEKPRPMDRLICGDVGYGKTEVALRGAFKAVTDNKQVAVLVPTTVLAEQHFKTFRERLQAFPLKIEVLSRFRSEKEQHSIVDELEKGTVDICIGTHRLLQKDVTFKNLGLVIIDEEQRFGVAHKERLKQMRKEVDVITLSATPIPRTLHMSLVGVRDMSTIETPPDERLPITTYIAEWDDRLVREAILRELERGGQVFFVHNRVQTISGLSHKLETLVPEARIAIAHGQMAEDALEKAMLDFTSGRKDVLVCTTIIESGLDMPNVNTLIVNNSDKLGLTQLYQLRGRVGRGTQRAYAYFLIEKGKQLTPQARKRLKTIFEAQELGAGFRIAMKDLEIRGAGNLLGVEQSGHIAAVGFDLYCQLLSEAVEESKARQDVPNQESITRPIPTIDLPLSAHLTLDYVPELKERLSLYQRLAKILYTDEIEDMARELTDRYGVQPLPVENLLYVIKIKLLATEAGIASISTDYERVILWLNHNTRGSECLSLSGHGPAVKVGDRQIQLNLRRLGDKWKSKLEQVLGDIYKHKSQKE